MFHVQGTAEGDHVRQGLRIADAPLAGIAILCAMVSWLTSTADAQPNPPPATCPDGQQIDVLASPVTPWKGAPLRITLASEKSIDGELQLVAPNGAVAARSRTRLGGPPYAWHAEVAAPAAGTWRVVLAQENAPADCKTLTRDVVVRASAPPRPGATKGSVWPIRASWTRGNENLYAAWIEKLFDAPLDASLSWPALHDVLRDRQRNMLFNHLGLGEDQMGLLIRPDCADLPYFLRAYFAFKMGLPFGYSKCTRGDGGGPPRCYEWWNIQNEDPRTLPPDPKAIAAARNAGYQPPWSIFGQPSPQPAKASGKADPKAQAAEDKPPRYPPRPAALAPAFGHYVRWTVAEGVHSGGGRTRANDDAGDYYPVALTAENLRPGTVYADPYGHLLVIAKRVPQSDGAAGVFLAVDAQPDGTVSRKRFWRGNFLYAQDPALGGPGFKRFRPVVATGSGGLRKLTNAEIARHPQYGDFSLDPSRLGIEPFYDRMDDLMSPAPLDPVRAMKEAITSLEEQVKARVTSVENGRKFQLSGKGEASMPDGAAIFETTGAWEDFATPSRDLRLLIAIDVVRGFPERVTRRPERYAMPAGKSAAEVKAELDAVLAADLAARRFTYPRSDGSPWSLSVKDVVDRAAALEMAYNVNDCVELRWGAPDGSDEAATCKRRAPAAQTAKMTQYRAWFSERRRPPRG